MFEDNALGKGNVIFIRLFFNELLRVQENRVVNRRIIAMRQRKLAGCAKRAPDCRALIDLYLRDGLKVFVR